MNHSRNVFVILLLLGIVTVCSAGCISFGSQTNEILVGNHTVGTVTLTPTDDILSLDPSAERVSVDVSILGNDALLKNMTDSEKLDLLSRIVGDESFDLSAFLGTTDGKTTTKEEADFWDSFFNMPISSTNNQSVSDAFTIPNLGNTIDDALASLEDFLNEIKL